MKILWHSNSPATAGGYGGQTRHAVRALRDLGHDVTISAFNLGPAGANISNVWDGFPVLPGGYRVYGNGVVAEHARRTGADLVFILVDSWTMDPGQFAGLNVAVWMAVDTQPLSAMDGYWLAEARNAGAKVTPVAMSRHGRKMLANSDHTAPYIPHSVDTDLFRPADDRMALRDAQGIPEGAFIVAMTADNKSNRKAHAAQMAGFAKFRLRHPNAYLRLHCDPRPIQESSYDLLAITRSLYLEDAIEFPDPYIIETGGYPESHMVSLYQTADVYLGASMAEGFGLPIIEAQACGTPVIATRASAMTELVPSSAGWLVGGQKWWNNNHAAWWVYPSADEIARKLERAYTGAGRMRDAARRHALTYDVKAISPMWAGIMEELQA